MATEFGEGRYPCQRNMYVVGAYKQQVLDMLKLNDDFQLAMLYVTAKEHLPNPSTPAGRNQILTRSFNECVFDHAFVPGTTNEKHIFVCMEVVCPYSDGITFKDLNINIYVFTPKMSVQWTTEDEVKTRDELIKRGYIGNKIDMVVDIIDRQLNGLKHMALGKIQLASSGGLQIFNYVDGYYGKQLVYTASDFNLLPPSALQANYLNGKPLN